MNFGFWSEPRKFNLGHLNLYMSLPLIGNQLSKLNDIPEYLFIVLIFFLVSQFERKIIYALSWAIVKKNYHNFHPFLGEKLRFYFHQTFNSSTYLNRIVHVHMMCILLIVYHNFLALWLCKHILYEIDSASMFSSELFSCFVYNARYC